MTPTQRIQAMWFDDLRALFPVPEEFEIASKIYWFAIAYDVGMTPQQAYDDFDSIVKCEAA
jgi:hypothetical protein